MESKKLFFLKNIKIEYSINKKFALGFMFSPLSKYKVQGYKHIKEYYLREYPSWSLSPTDSGIILTGEFNGNGYYLTAAYMPVPDVFLRKSSFKLGVGIGLSAINLNFIVSEKTSFSKSSLCFITFAEYDYYLNRHWSIGVNIDYKYVPFKIRAFQSIGYYDDVDSKNNKVVRSLVIDFPEKRVNFGVHL